MTTPAARDAPLADRVALVTGAGVRIGAAIAEHLASLGADVVVHYHASDAGAQETRAKVEAHGRRAWLLPADFRDPAEAAELVQRARRDAGRVDLLVNNASVYPQAPMDATPLEEVASTMDVNAWSPLEAMRAFAAGAPADAVIVNVLDTHVHAVMRDRFAYQASKQMLTWLTRYGALAFAPRVRVNGVAPGAILPPPWEGHAYLDRLARHVPLGRHGDPLDVAEAVAYLATARYVTGVMIEIDGGEHLGGVARA